MFFIEPIESQVIQFTNIVIKFIGTHNATYCLKIKKFRKKGGVIKS